MNEDLLRNVRSRDKRPMTLKVPIQVLLLRNVFEERNLSMKLYAERLERALLPYVEVRRVRPWQPMQRNRLPSPLRQALDYALRYSTYPRSLTRRSADIYHIIDHAYSHLVSRLPAERTVITCHDLMLIKLAAGEFGRQHVPRIATVLLEKSLSDIARAAVIIAVSSSTARDLTNYLGIPPHRINVIHHGVDGEYQPLPDPQSRAYLRERYGLAGHAVILHVGGNSRYKNIEGLMEALAYLRRTLPQQTPLLIKAGKPLSPAQRERAQKLGISSLIHEVGMRSREELQNLYWMADVLAFPSLWEGFGWPPLEAMASGTPVVTTHRGALEEVAGDAAEIVDPEDPEDIARGIARVLLDPVRRCELTSKGYDRVKLFRWDEAARQTAAVYAEVLGFRAVEHVLVRQVS